ncbi:MAG: hypothetical protein LW698_01200 [Planctomycetaceae bacterium]|nr:hypothetical protein [Planctomycetaceae bacterium]
MDVAVRQDLCRTRRRAGADRDKYTHTLDRRRLAALREFVAERGGRYGLVITNDSEPRLLDEAIPFSHL